MPRGVYLTEDEQRAIIAAYTAGETIRRIAADTGRSFGGVYGVLYRAGTPMRRRGRSKVAA